MATFEPGDRVRHVSLRWIGTVRDVEYQDSPLVDWDAPNDELGASFTNVSNLERASKHCSVHSNCLAYAGRVRCDGSTAKFDYGDRVRPTGSSSPNTDPLRSHVGGTRMLDMEP